jgi:hypothetical protein
MVFRKVNHLVETAIQNDTQNSFSFFVLLQFVRFANIEEDTPSYHRRYDFFVSKFSSMCHSNDSEPELRDKIRLAGIKGLQVSNSYFSCYIIHICKASVLSRCSLKLGMFDFM